MQEAYLVRQWRFDAKEIKRWIAEGVKKYTELSWSHNLVADAK